MYLSMFEALEKKYLLQFQYCGYFRVIEPHVYGHDPRFGDVVRGYQIAGADEFGKHRGWKWFRASKIEGLQVMPVHFTGPRKGAQLTVERLERLFSHLDGMTLTHPKVTTPALPPAAVVDC